MPPNNANSSSSEEDDPSSASYSDDRDDVQESKSVVPAANGMKQKAQNEQRSAGEVEPSPRSSASAPSSAPSSAVAAETKSNRSNVWVPPVLLPIKDMPQLDMPVLAPIKSKKKGRGEGEEKKADTDVFDLLSAGLDALEAAVDAAAAGSSGGGKARAPSRPSSAPSSRHLVEALAAAGAIPASARGKVKVFPSLPDAPDATRGVGLPATAADFESWLDLGQRLERGVLNVAAGKADLGADGDDDDDDFDAASLPRHAAREAARRWLRATHGASPAAEAKAAAAAQEDEEEKVGQKQAEERDEEDATVDDNGPTMKWGSGELMPGLGSAKRLLLRGNGSGGGGSAGEGGDFGGGDGEGSYFDDEDAEDEGRRSLGRRLAGAAGAVGGAVGGAVSAPIRLVFRRGGRKRAESDAAAERQLRYSSPLMGNEMEGEAPLPSSKLSRAERRALGPARLALLVAREKGERLAARDARAAAAWRAKQRKLEALRTRSYAQRAADETARLTEGALLGPAPPSLSDEEDAAGRAELPQDEAAKRPTPTTVVREPAFAAGRRLDRTSRAARPSGVKPAMAPSVAARELAGRLSLSLFGRGIFGVREDLEAAINAGGEDFFAGTAEARNPLARFLPPQLRPEPPLVGFGVYARPGSVAKFLGREYLESGGGDGSPSEDDGDGDGDDDEVRALRHSRESRWASMPPLKAVGDPLFYADLMRVAPEIGLTVVAWVPRPLPAAALARYLGEAAAANAAAAAAAAFRDDLALRRRALASGALPPLPSPADVVDYSEGIAADDDDYVDEEEGAAGGAGGGGATAGPGPSWPCLRAGKLAERAARGAAHQLASAAGAAARATAAHEAALAEVAELRRRRLAAATAASTPAELLSGRSWRRLGKQLAVRLSPTADALGTSAAGSALPKPALPDSAYVVDRGVFEGALPEKDGKKKKKKKKKKEGRNGEGGGASSSDSDSDSDDDGEGLRFGRGLGLSRLDDDDIDPDLIVVPEGEPWIDSRGNIRPGSKLIFSAAPGGGLVVEALPPSRGFWDDAEAARANGGVPPPKPGTKNPLSPLVDAWKKFGGLPVDPAEDSSLPRPSTDDAKRAKLVAICGPGSAGALLGALLGPKPIDKLARARVGQRAAFELHTPEAEAEKAALEAASAARSSSSAAGLFDPAVHNLSMTWLASLDAQVVRESMPQLVDSLDAATAPFTLPLLPRADGGGDASASGSRKSSSSFYRRAAPPTLLRGVSAAAAFARRRAFPRQQAEAEEEEEAASWGEDDGSEYEGEGEERL